MKNLLLSIFMAGFVNKKTTHHGDKPKKSKGLLLTILFKRGLKKRKLRKEARIDALQATQDELLDEAHYAYLDKKKAEYHNSH